MKKQHIIYCFLLSLLMSLSLVNGVVVQVGKSDSANNIYIFNNATSWNVTYEGLVKWGYNQTTATNTLYDYLWYNYSLTPHTNIYNVTYNTWSYNQSDGSYNATYDDKNSSRWQLISGNISYVNGNVGIGTTAPSAKLQVESGNFWVNGSGSAAGMFYNATSARLGVNTVSPIDILHLMNGALVIQGNNSVGHALNVSGILYVNASSGNVGIGTTGSLYKLDVRGTSGLSQLHFASSDVDSGGYLVSASANNFFMSGGTMWNGSNWVAKATEASLIGSSGVASGDLVLYTNSGLTVGNTFNPTARMVIQNTGNVGIGTASPAKKLSVNVSDTTNTQLILEQAGTGDAGILFLLTGVNNWAMGVDNNDSDRFKIGTSTSFSTSFLDITTTGNVGIGTTNSSAKLAILKAVTSNVYNSLISLEDTGTSSNSSTGIDWRNSQYGWEQGRISVLRDGADNSFDMLFSTSKTGVNYERMRINEDGNVGIGTVKPTYPLTVMRNVSGISIWSDGNISATEYITRTSVWDNKKGSALNYFYSPQTYKNIDGSVNHSAYGVGVVNMPFNKKNGTKIISENATTNYTIDTYEEINVEGVSLDGIVAKHEQAIYELNEKNKELEATLCKLGEIKHC